VRTFLGLLQQTLGLSDISQTSVPVFLQALLNQTPDLDWGIGG